MLNVLGVLACRRELIDRILELRELKNNVLAVWIFMDGRWQLYVLDSLFPAYGSSITSKLIFSHANNNDVWAAVLEKAYAKALKSYYKVLLPNAVATLQHFTGLPAEKLPMYDLKELWTRLKEHLKKSNVVVSEFKDEDGFERLFVVVNFFEHPTCRLLKIKNGYKCAKQTAQLDRRLVVRLAAVDRRAAQRLRLHAQRPSVQLAQPGRLSARLPKAS